MLVEIIEDISDPAVSFVAINRFKSSDIQEPYTRYYLRYAVHGGYNSDTARALI